MVGFGSWSNLKISKNWMELRKLSESNDSHIICFSFFQQLAMKRCRKIRPAGVIMIHGTANGQRVNSSHPGRHNFSTFFGRTATLYNALHGYCGFAHKRCGCPICKPVCAPLYKRVHRKIILYKAVSKNYPQHLNAYTHRHTYVFNYV